MTMVPIVLDVKKETFAETAKSKPDAVKEPKLGDKKTKPVSPPSVTNIKKEA